MDINYHIKVEPMVVGKQPVTKRIEFYNLILPAMGLL